MNTKIVTHEEAVSIGAALGINFEDINIEEFSIGLSVELEHRLHDSQTDVTHNDVLQTGKIAWAHLKEIPDYYTRLAKMELEANS